MNQPYHAGAAPCGRAQATPSAIRQLASKRSEVDHESVSPLSGKGQDEIGPVELRDPCGTLLVPGNHDVAAIKIHTRRQQTPDGDWDGWPAWPDPKGGDGKFPYYTIKL